MVLLNSGPVMLSFGKLARWTPVTNKNFVRNFSLTTFLNGQVLKNTDNCFVASSNTTLKTLANSFFVYDDFITESEEISLFKESENYLKRLRYETAHWDNAIHGYREVERHTWNEENRSILDRVKKLAFNDSTSTMSLVHVLDLQKTGFIKPHVDSVKFCGGVIAGISLLSPAVMRLALEKDPTQYGDCLLKPRSLYIMTGTSRYDFTHEILKDEESVFKGEKISRDRRISVMCRCEPDQKQPLPDT